MFFKFYISDIQSDSWLERRDSDSWNYRFKADCLTAWLLSNIRLSDRAFTYRMYGEICVCNHYSRSYLYDQYFLTLLHTFFMLDIFIGLEPIPLPYTGSVPYPYTKLLITATLYSQCNVAHILHGFILTTQP